MKRNKEKITLKIILIGSVSVGKSSLLKRYMSDTFNQASIKPTIGVDFATKIIESDDILINLQLFDTAGQEKYHYQLGNQFYRNADGVILVYDISKPSKDSVEGLNRWLDEVISKTYDEVSNERVPIVVAGNKADLKNIEENNDDVINFCKEHELGHIETSAKDSYKSVEAALLAVTSLALTQHRKKVRETVPKESINLNDMYKKTDKKGCMDCS
jgi:small GTP-binding protein